MRLKITVVFALTAMLCIVSPAFSQGDFKSFSHVSVGIKASTLGSGFEAATPLNKMLALRLGVNLTCGLDIPSALLNKLVGKEYSTEFTKITGEDNEYFMDRFNCVPDFKAKSAINFTHGNLLCDFYPFGGFHLTTGLFMGTSKFRLNGSLVNPSNGQLVVLDPAFDWPTFDLGGVPIEMKGPRSNLEVQLGKTLKPYLGFGFGRAVPKKRVSFKFEMGLLYQGTPTFKYDGKLINLAASTQEEMQDINDILDTWYAKVWPMINFQLCYKIF